MILEEQKEGSVVTENPKGGIAENFRRIHSGDHSNLFGKLRHRGRGGSRKSSKVIKGGSAKFHLVQLKILPPPQAINNDRSLIWQLVVSHVHGC